MSLRIRAVHIDVNTTGPNCGTQLEFGEGLNVLRASNSSGKSTCLQAIIYGLGLEGMLSARREVPLPHSVTDHLMVDGKEYAVQDSSVAVEIDNGAGDVLTLRRAVKSATADRALIRSWAGPALTSTETDFRETDYFVRRPGAAQREAGFHTRLAQFLGWDLPRVTKFDGSEAPLYLECLFPFFYVEQKHGWTGIQARIPSYLGIRDVSVRSTEFILSLDSYQKALERQRLLAASAEIESEWKSIINSVHTVCATTGLVATGLPQTPAAARDGITVVYLFNSGTAWQPAGQRIEELRGRLRQDAERAVPTVADQATDLESGLAAAQEALDDAIVRLRLANDRLRASTTQRDNLDLRIEALREDLQRHRDAALLAQLGSAIATSPDELAVCPTCHQDLHDGMDVAAHVMTIDESIGHIERQLQTFVAMRDDVDRAAAAESAAVRSQRTLLGDLRSQVRAHSDALVGPNGAPSLASVTDRVLTQQALSQLTSAMEELAKLQSDLARLAGLWSTNRALLGAQSVGPSMADASKTDYFQRSLRSQLAAYEFSSMESTAIDVSRETYRPIHEGFDLGFDLSASDMVRLIWSYLLGVLDTGANFPSNHPGLVIFDEPKQQDTARSSYEALLRRASQLAGGSQIIIATSEDEVSIRAMLENVPHVLKSFPSGAKILQPLNA